MDKLLVIIIGLFGMGFTYWFFLMKKDKEVAVTDSINITVNGGYQPSTIAIQQGKTTTLNFKRTDDNSCLEDVVLADFKVRRHLPLNQTVSIAVTPKEKGEFTYSCGMNMFHGKIIVK